MQSLVRSRLYCNLKSSVLSRSLQQTNKFKFPSQQQSIRKYQQSSYGYGEYNNATPRITRDQLIFGGVAVAGLIGSYFVLDQLWNKPVAVATANKSEREELLTTAALTSGSTSGFKPIENYVHQYLLQTYQKVAAGLAITAGSAYALYRTGFAYRIMNANPWVYMIGSFAATMGTLFATRSIDSQNKVAKYTAFTAFNVVMGASLCMLGFMQPQILMRAGLYTAGVFGAMSFAAMTARDEKFLYLGGPLFAGLTMLIIANFASLLLPARFATTHNVLNNLVMYGGLLLFSLFLLYDTQVVMKHARIYQGLKVGKEQTGGIVVPTMVGASGEELRDYVASYSSADKMRMTQSGNYFPEPDYVNESIGIYMDLINIFIRFVMILSNGNRKRN